MSTLKIIHRQLVDALHIYELKSNPFLAKHNTIARVLLSLFADNFDMDNGNGNVSKRQQLDQRQMNEMTTAQSNQWVLNTMTKSYTCRASFSDYILYNHMFYVLIK